MFRGVIEFSISLVECFKDCLHGQSYSSPWLGLCQSLMAWVIKPSWLWQEVGMRFWRSKNVCAFNHSWSNVSAMCETLYGFIFWRTFVGLGYYLVLASLWKTVDAGISPSSSSPGPSFLLLLLLAEHYPGLSVTKTVLYSCALINLIPYLTTDLHDESKTDLSLRHKCCEKFHVFQGWTRRF
jgi:hypothetical protein